MVDYRRKVGAILYGQLIALILASVNASSYAIMFRYHVDTQLFQLFGVYLVLSLHIFFVPRPGSRDPVLEKHHSQAMTPSSINSTPPPRTYSFGLKGAPWWVYLLISILDVGPNFMTLLSYKYTSLMSTTLLGSLTAPSTMMFSALLLRRLFRLHHYIGVILCVLGGMLTIWLDTTHQATKSTASTEESLLSPYAYVGDLLAILSALIFGLGDTLAEYFVKYADRMEYLGMLGIFGSLFTGLTFPFREWNAIESIWEPSPLTAMDSPHSPSKVVVLILVYITLVVAYYVTEASFLVHSDATLLNISMQSCNVWAIVFSSLVFQEVPSYLFFSAFVLVLIGVVVYEIPNNPISLSRSKDDTQSEIPEEFSEPLALLEQQERQMYGAINV